MKKPESWITRELKLIAPELYPLWINRFKKWFIVKDFSRRVAGVTDYDPILGKNFVVELVLEDEKRRPIPLDARTLRAIRRSLYEKNKYPISYFLKQIDSEEEERARRAEQGSRERRGDLSRKINKFAKTKTFIYGGIKNG